MHAYNGHPDFLGLRPRSPKPRSSGLTHVMDKGLNIREIEEFKSWLVHHRFAHVEISDGTVEIPRERKLELIADFARDFTVLSEVGSKDSSVEFASEEWTTWLREELDAGAWKVITEAREGGSAGIFTKAGDMRTDLVDDIARAVPLDDV